MNNIFSYFTRRDARRHFERLLTPHLPQLYRLSYRFTGKREDAEDLVQDLLIQLFPRVNEMRSIVNLKPWLSRCLYNRYIDTRRKAARDPLGDLGDDNNTLLEAMEHHDRPDIACYQKQVLRMLEQLDDKDRVVVNLHDVEGYSIKEIEVLIEMPVGTIKSRLHRARKKLREGLLVQPSYSEERVNSISATGEQHEL